MPRTDAAARAAAPSSPRPAEHPLPTQKTRPLPSPDARTTQPVRPVPSAHTSPRPAVQGRSVPGARPAPGRRSPLGGPPAPNGKPEQGRCQRCGEVVIACWDAQDRLVPVHPVAVPGGELIVNASQARIVQVLSHREASAAHRRGELGFLPHARICRGLGYAS